jgi:hypothetical protein
MEEKEPNGGSGSLIRVIIFLLVVGGLVWYLFADSDKPNSNNVLGETETSGVFSDQASTFFEGLAKKINTAVPAPVKTVVEEKIVKQTQKTIDESVLVNEIKKTIEQTTDQISGFPEKQQKDIKRQVIEQVCNDLLESVDENGN